MGGVGKLPPAVSGGSAQPPVVLGGAVVIGGMELPPAVNVSTVGARSGSAVEAKVSCLF